MARDGVVAQDQKDLLELNHHPVRSIKGASRYLSWRRVHPSWPGLLLNGNFLARFQRASV